MNEREHIWAEAMRAERRGDAAAYEKLLREIATSLRVAIRGRLSRSGANAHEAEDIVQDVLIGLHTMRHRWDQDRPFLPWLYAIVRYKFSDAARRRKREAIFHSDLSFEEWCDVVDVPAHAIDGNPIDVDRALNGLPASQRDVVRSLAIDGASVRETAQRLETTEGTVRMTLHRALQRLIAAAHPEVPNPKSGKP